MPKQLSDIVKLIAEKVGLDLTDKSMIDLLSVSATVGDEAFGKIESGLNSLLTVETAKHNSQLAAHFKANALLPADTEIAKLLDEFGFDDTLKGEFATEKSTYKKIGLLAKKVQELEAKKAGASGGDKKALQDEILKLNKAIADTKADYENKIKTLQSESENNILNYALESHLGGKQYADSIPEAIRVSSALQLINKELAAKGAKAVRAADGSIKLIQSANPDLDYLENNKPVAFGEFSDKVLSTHAMLKVSGQPPKGKGATTQKDINPTPGAEGNELHIAAIDNDLAALEAATK